MTKNSDIIGVGCDLNAQESKYKINGRKLAIENLSGGEKDKISWMTKNMHHNKAYKYAVNFQPDKNKKNVLDKFKKKYIKYRENWHNQPKLAFSKKLFGKKLQKEKINPLCIDIEVASVCDLACPFCYRQYISTPDKVMSKTLAFKLIDQAAELGVPSMKFNWRGEPLLNPQLSIIVDYAKKRHKSIFNLSKETGIFINCCIKST